MGCLFKLDAGPLETHRRIPRLRHALWNRVLRILRPHNRLSLQLVPGSVSVLELHAYRRIAYTSSLAIQLLVLRWTVCVTRVSSVAGQSGKQGRLPKHITRTVRIPFRTGEIS